MILYYKNYQLKKFTYSIMSNIDRGLVIMNILLINLSLKLSLILSLIKDKQAVQNNNNITKFEGYLVKYKIINKL